MSLCTTICKGIYDIRTYMYPLLLFTNHPSFFFGLELLPLFLNCSTIFTIFPFFSQTLFLIHHSSLDFPISSLIPQAHPPSLLPNSLPLITTFPFFHKLFPLFKKSSLFSQTLPFIYLAFVAKLFNSKARRRMTPLFHIFMRNLDNF